MSLPKRCVDLTEDHIDEGLKSVESMRVLLEHLAHVAKPKEGAAKILVAISRIATTSCEWLEGTLHVEMDDLLGATEIAVMSDLGGGVRELILPRLMLTVDYEEMVNAVKVAPKLIVPLKYRIRGERMVMKREVPGTVAPPSFEIAEESLRRSLPPKLARSLPPISGRGASGTKEESIEGAILARVFPKTVRTLVIDDLAAVDVGWDFGAYSSTVNTRETKPPPPPKTPSKIPTRPPAAPAKETHAKETPAPSRKPRPSKAPPPPPVPRPAAAKKPSKIPPKAPSKRPPKAPSKAPPAERRRPVIRKIGSTKP